MATLAELSVALPPDMIAVVQQAMETGEFATPSEVVEDALRAWTTSRTNHFDVEHLRSAWSEAIADDSPGIPMDEVFDRLDKRYEALITASESPSSSRKIVQRNPHA